MTRDRAATLEQGVRARYRAHCQRRLVEQYASAVPLGLGFNLVLAGLCAAAGDPHAAGTLTGVAAAFALTYPLVRRAWFRQHPYVVIMGIAALCAVGAAALTSASSTYQTSGWGILLVCWGMGATHLSLPPPVVAVGIAMQLVIFEVVLHLTRVPPLASPGLVYGLQLCGGLLALEGSRRLHGRDRVLFEEESELRRREAALRFREAELSARGRQREEQARRLVEEHLRGAKTIEALEALLSERVRLRSRRIAEVVSQDPRPFAMSPTSSVSGRGAG